MEGHLDNAATNILESTLLEDIGDEDGVQVEDFENCVDEWFSRVEKLEQRMSEVEQFYSTTSRKHLNTSKASSVVRDKDKEKQVGYKKRQHDTSRREAASAKRMQELMHQFGAILRQITQHKWAGPFMQPVDVEGLGLHDYYEVIDKPMDFSTIKNKMEAKDDSGYKNVREMCADVRLIFKNAMKYNDERDDVHVMAKTLLAKFEEKWLQLLPKVDEEEKRRKDEESEAQLDIQLAQEVAHAKMAKDLSIELEEADSQLEELREMVLQKCRRISTTEKKALQSLVTHLSIEDLNKALLIIAQNNPDFQLGQSEVDLDLDTQNESTLWKLKFFVQDALEAQKKIAASMGAGGNNNDNNIDAQNNNNNNKRKRENVDDPAKNNQKKNRNRLS